METPLLTIEQRLPSNLNLLEDAVAGIIAMIKCAGCFDHVDKIDLAVREAITNAIIHGNKYDKSKVVHICVELSRARGLHIVIKDAGHGFDPGRLPNPLAPQGRVSNHGRGIFLIRKCMDDVQFSFESGTAIHMRRYCGAPDSPALPPEAELGTENQSIQCGRGFGERQLRNAPG